MKHFRPKGSPYFGTLEKITTITPENGQFIFGDPNWVGNTTDIREFTVESLFEKIEPVSSNPPNPSPELLRVSLPPDIKSVDIFQVLSVAAFSYGVFGYFVQIVEPDSEGMGYREQEITGLLMSTICATILDAAEVENVQLGEEGWTFQGKEILGDDRDHSYDSESSTAIVLDDGNPRGIFVGAQREGRFHAVYEGEDDQASLIGILALTSTAGPHDEKVFSDEEILENDWSDGVNAMYVAEEYEEQGDYENAFRWYEISAKQGSPEAEKWLANEVNK